MIEMYLDENGKFVIPSHIKNIRLDIGLSYCAPNSTIWLSENSDTFVIGVEANKYACNTIMTNGFIAHQKNLAFSFPHQNFILLKIK